MKVSASRLVLSFGGAFVLIGIPVGYGIGRCRAGDSRQRERSGTG